MRKPVRTVASQSGTASPKLIDNWVVGVNVYGNRPSRFMLSRKAIREVKRKAHLWAGIFRGRRSCLVNEVKNQFWEVIRRLLTHLAEGAGNSSQGVSIARKIRGMPREVVEANWLNKSIIMVRFTHNYLF